MGYWIAVGEVEGGEVSVEIWVRFRGKPMLAMRFLGAPSLVPEVRAFAPRMVAALAKRLSNSVSATFSVGRH